MYESLDVLLPMTEQISALDSLIDHWKGQAAAA